jgi:hypothetical protein
MDLARRTLLGGLAGLSFCTCCRAEPGFGSLGGRDAPPVTPPTDTVAKPRSGPPRSSRRVNMACALAAEEGEDGGGPRLLDSSGDPYLDQIFARETKMFMPPIFQVRPDCAFYDDGGSPNAFATTERMIGSGQGTVAFGVGLIQELKKKFSGRSQTLGVHAMGGVYGHEYGHIAQFSAGIVVGGAKQELHADFLAGWYTAIRNIQQAGIGVNFPEIAQQMFDIGDFAFTDRNHHGTPDQRVRAYVAGVHLTNQTMGRATIQDALAMGARYVGL